MRISGNNILKIYQIRVKLCMGICLYILLICIKFHSNWAGISCFTTFFKKCAEWTMYLSPLSPLEALWEEKMKKKILKRLLALILGMLRVIFKFEMWPPLSGGCLHCKFGAIQIRHHRATCVWKSWFVVPVNILTKFVHAPFSWATQQATMCLDLV